MHGTDPERHYYQCITIFDKRVHMALDLAVPGSKSPDAEFQRFLAIH